MDNLDSAIENIRKTSGSVGLSVVVCTSDSILFAEGFGFSDHENSFEVTPETTFSIGSITKTFTAIGILKLVEEGLIQLDDMVFDLAPDIPLENSWEEEYPLRVLHLLEHTSGVDDLHPKDYAYPVDNEEMSLLESANLVKNSLITRWEPGSRFAYSNAGYLVAGYLIEKLSGQSYNEFIQSRILDPLDMDQSGLTLQFIDSNRTARSYNNNLSTRSYKRIISRPAGALMCSSNDMAKFMQALMKQDTVLMDSASYYEFERHHSLAIFQGTNNGYRLGIQPNYHKDIFWLGHGGAINGFRSEFRYNRELDAGIFVVSNGPNSNEAVNRTLDYLLDQIVEPTEEVTKSETSSMQSDSLSGYYQFVSPRNSLFYPFNELLNGGILVKSYGDSLTYEGIGVDKTTLYVSGANRFSKSGGSDELQYFFPSEESGVLLTGLGWRYEKTSLGLLIFLVTLCVAAFGVILISQVVLIYHIFSSIYKKTRIPLSKVFLEIASIIFVTLAVLFILGGNPQNSFHLNPLNGTLFVITIIYPLIVSYGSARLFWFKISGGLISQIYQVSLCFSHLIWVIFLINWNLVGFQYWTY